MVDVVQALLVLLFTGLCKDFYVSERHATEHGRLQRQGLLIMVGVVASDWPLSLKGGHGRGGGLWRPLVLCCAGGRQEGIRR